MIENFNLTRTKGKKTNSTELNRMECSLTDLYSLFIHQSRALGSGHIHLKKNDN